MNILLLNGPNLNLTGRREPALYGSESFEEFIPKLVQHFPDHQIQYRQHNVEGELINIIQELSGWFDALVINAGAYAHTSLALADAIRALDCPIIEVHMSNVYSRESVRHHSYLSGACRGVICGFGMMSYKLAIYALLEQVK